MGKARFARLPAMLGWFCSENALEHSRAGSERDEICRAKGRSAAMQAKPLGLCGREPCIFLTAT